MHFPLSFCKNASPTFSMVHLSVCLSVCHCLYSLYHLYTVRLYSLYSLSSQSICLSVCLPKSGVGVMVGVEVRDHNLGLAQLMYITELVEPGDVQLKMY